MSELLLRMSCATPAAECNDTNTGVVLVFDPLAGLVQIGALVVVVLVIVFVVRARRR